MEKEKNPNSEMDIITNLPELIRNHILSFLPIVDAIRTSILSTQWRNICSSLPNLSFDQQLFDEMPSSTNNQTRFQDSVTQFIHQRDERASVQSFKLVVDDVQDSILPHIRSWVSYVLRRKVERLYLSVYSRNLDILPCSLFTSKTLTVLSLSDIHFELPTVVEFPLVKSLELIKVRWSDYEDNNRLVSSCPLLQSLVLVMCSWNKSNRLVIDSPNLKSLVFRPAVYSHEVRISSSIKICNLKYSGHLPDVSVESLSSLLYAELLIFPATTTVSTQNITDRVPKIFMGMQNVVHLELGGQFLEILSRYLDVLSKNTTVFCSTKRLRLGVYSAKCQVQFVASLLRIFPNLRSLTMCLEPDLYARVRNIGGSCQPQKSSDHAALEEITINEFRGSDLELYLVQCLLENAKVLKTIRIIYSEELDEDDPRRSSIGEKIAQFEKASPVAMISFV
ncbi:hypothetical protein ACHQM5_018998 [Ranunculus cassubicifolius]